MGIIRAESGQLEIVKTIVTGTIKEIYPRYYPKGAVDFFLSHHDDESISRDLESGCVFLYRIREQNAAGTLTIRANEICRLFVLPQYQKQGFGRALMDFAEDYISGRYKTSRLDASLPAKSLYLKRGYTEVESHSIQTESGDYLCYDVMEKCFVQ